MDQLIPLLHSVPIFAECKWKIWHFDNNLLIILCEALRDSIWQSQKWESKSSFYSFIKKLILHFSKNDRRIENISIDKSIWNILHGEVHEVNAVSVPETYSERSKYLHIFLFPRLVCVIKEKDRGACVEYYKAQQSQQGAQLKKKNYIPVFLSQSQAIIAIEFPLTLLHTPAAFHLLVASPYPPGNWIRFPNSLGIYFFFDAAKRTVTKIENFIERRSIIVEIVSTRLRWIHFSRHSWNALYTIHWNSWNESLINGTICTRLKRRYRRFRVSVCRNCEM